MKATATVGGGLLWAMAIGFLAFSYGYLGVASGWIGFWTLGVLAVASVGILLLFRGCSKGTALVNAEMCLLALWFGHVNGTMVLGGGCDIAWFCISFLWPWLFTAIVGGIVLVAVSGKTPSTSSRTAWTAAAILLVAAGLLAGGYAYLFLFGEQPVTSFRALRFFLQTIAFSPDGKVIATVGGWDKNVRLWDATTGRALGECDQERANNGTQDAAIQCFGNPPTVAALSYLSEYPNSGDKIVIQTWDLATRQPQQRMQWDDSLDPHRSKFSQDGRWFVYSNGNLRAFDLQAQRVIVDLKRPKDRYVRCLAVSPSRDRIACATEKTGLEIWNVAQSKMTQQIQTTHPVSCLEFSPDGRYLACGTNDGAVELIEMNTEHASRTIRVFDHESVNAIAFSPDGALLACGGANEGKTKVIDVKRETVVAVLHTWGGWRTACLAFSPDGSRLGIGDSSGRVSVWDATKWTGK